MWRRNVTVTVTVAVTVTVTETRKRLHAKTKITTRSEFFTVHEHTKLKLTKVKTSRCVVQIQKPATGKSGSSRCHHNHSYSLDDSIPVMADVC
jgi:hypothetical protein